MGLNDSPVKMPELNLIPETDRGIELDKGMKQVMSLLTAYCGEQRVALRCSQNGILYVTSPQIKDIIHVKGVAVTFKYQGDNIACSEVLVMGHPDNIATVWVKPHAPALGTNAWPLAKNDVVGLGITNLSMLNLLFGNDTDTAIIAYTM